MARTNARSGSIANEGGYRDLVGRVIGDKYSVTAVIGEGGMGAVYEAKHLHIGRLVAVKVLHPKEAQKHEAVSRLEHEARVAGRIGHPNICEVYDIGRLPDGSPYLVMERLHGETLAQRILRVGPVPPHEVVDIMLQVLSALVTAHERGIIHRDLKPENIFLSQRSGMLPVAKILDFGISKASDLEGTPMDLTQPGMVMGTPYYMAPEQARGDRQLDHRVDLWAVGVILYEALTGQRPFVAKNYNALLVQILTIWHRPVSEWNPSVHQKLSRVVDKALAKAREERFQSAGDFLDVLRRFKKRSNTPAPQPRPATPVRVHTIVDETTDDGTMVFARLQDIQPESHGSSDERPIVVASTLAAPAASRAGSRSEPEVDEEDSTTANLRVGAPSAPRSTKTAQPAKAPPSRRAPSQESDDATIVDPPELVDDSVTMVRRDPRRRGDRG